MTERTLKQIGQRFLVIPRNTEARVVLFTQDGSVLYDDPPPRGPFQIELEPGEQVSLADPESPPAA